MASAQTIHDALTECLLPGMVLRVGCDAGDYAALPATERHLEQSAGALRRAQFAAARRLARDALDALGYGVCALLRQSDGSPAWPDGVIGSLSHTHGLAAAVTARRRDFIGIGLDIEATTTFPAAAIDTVLTRAEQRAATDDSLRLRSFCAKEAIYKCLAPLGAIDLAFLDIELAWEAEPDVNAKPGMRGCRFTARAITPRAARILNLPLLRGYCMSLAPNAVGSAAICSIPAPR